MGPERSLYIVRIVHTPGDFGSLKDVIPTSDELELAAAKLGVEIDRKLKALYRSGVIIHKVFQDGMPDVPEEDRAKIMAKAQTPDYDVLRWLSSQGASVRGTEDPIALRKIYDALAEIKKAKSGFGDEEALEALAEAKLNYANCMAVFMENRDNYMAQRIHSDLLPGETGILFIGAQHTVAQLLEKDVQILYLPGLQEAQAKAFEAYTKLSGEIVNLS